jgi:outer membrane protein assembly factor BamB
MVKILKGKMLVLVVVLLISINSIGLTSTVGIKDFYRTRQNNEDEFPMFRGGIDRLGVYKTKSPDYAILLWNYSTGNQIQSSPVLYQNNIYFGSDDSNVYCLNADTGAKIWNFTTKNLVQSTPTIVDGKLYIGSNDFNVYCLDPDDGKLIWQYKTEGPIVSSPLVVNDTVFIGSYDKNVYAVNALNGSWIWNFTTGHEIWASPTYADNSIFIGSLDGEMYALWAENGTKKWNFSTITDKWEKGIYSSCAIFQDQLYYGCEDQNVYALDIHTGKLIWHFETEGYLYSSPAIHNELLFIAGLGLRPNGELFALPINDPDSNGIITADEVVWRSLIYDIDGGSSPIVVDNNVIIGSNYKDVGGNGKLICFDELSGDEVWNFTTGGDVHSTPIPSINKIFIGSLDNNLYCIGSTEKPLMEISSSHSIENNMIEAGRTIDIEFTTTAFGEIVEQPWYTFETTGGELSATFGTGFSDGKFKISFTAPLVTQNTSVTIKAKTVKVGYENGSHELTFFIEPIKKDDSDEDEISKFIDDIFAERNQIYCFILLILIIINVIVFILILRKRQEKRKQE